MHCSKRSHYDVIQYLINKIISLNPGISRVVLFQNAASNPQLNPCKTCVVKYRIYSNSFVSKIIYSHIEIVK